MGTWRAADAAGTAGMSMSCSSLIPAHLGHVAAPFKTFSVEKWNKMGRSGAVRTVYDSSQRPVRPVFV